ncbi:PREDICTED: uncharacterized protein LOC104781650 [Camelina sativa]|uniref:Uncharacterized protein LOC104781650 n=1 Tax=Camelina sativa TaxID=90675 RepID=A0ABM0YR41_CAMSA|nr:PREDICTED: uncharacterized protein LOC104781650 [Camelina sativa]
MSKVVGHTCVFWDVEDCQVPDGNDPDSISENMKSVLADTGYGDVVQIMAYGEKNKIRDQFLLAEITFIPEGDKLARVNRMMKDVLFWALDNRVHQSVRRNVMVISQNISKDFEFICVLQGLQSRGYKVLLADDSDDVASVEQHEFVSSLWLWTSLLDGGDPIDKNESSQSLGKKLKRKECEPSSTPTCSGSSDKKSKPLEPESAADAGSRD